MSQAWPQQTQSESVQRQPIITLVVAMGRNRVIGINGRMPWHLPADLKHFKDVTMGKPVIMGRRTFESIGKPLPGRRNIVVSRRHQGEDDGVIWVASLDDALAHCRAADEVMIAGGGMLYREALPHADRLWITEVDCAVDGDTWFPELTDGDWGLVSIEEHPADERHAFAMQFTQLERINRDHDNAADASNPATRGQ